jgi:ABC-type transport system substrate-binding protein
VTVVDGHTVRIALKEPFAAFLAPLADPKVDSFVHSQDSLVAYEDVSLRA